MPTQSPAARPDEGAATIPPRYTPTAHGGGGGYTVTDPSSDVVGDGLADVFDAVRTAQQHAAGGPVAAPGPSHTLNLPVRCTIADLRALLRQVPGSATSADVRVLGTQVIAPLPDLAGIELKLTGGAR